MSDWTVNIIYILELIYFAIPLVSLAMCIMAIGLIIHFKFYRSFNYRLILYLLISFLIFALCAFGNNILLIASSLFYLPKSSEVEYNIDVFIISYSLWNVQHFTAFMIAQIFFMVVFFIELRKAEIPITIACFILPLIPAILSVLLPSDVDLFFSFPYAVGGMIVAGACVVAIAIVLVVLACRSLKWCTNSNNDNEEQHLLHQHTRQSYRTALKESLPFIIYPIANLVWLLIYTCTDRYIYILLLINESMGTLTAVVFLLHIKIIGQKRRNVFRRRACIIPPTNTAHEINEEQHFTAAGSITATHVTHFHPLGEDDIEV